MDIQILLLLQQFRDLTGGVLNGFFTFITNIAVDYYVAVPALIIFWAIDKKKGARILMTWGTALGINAFLKTTFCVYRPWIRSSEIKPVEAAMAGATGYSFPSGHSTSAGGFYGGLYMAWRKFRGLCIFAVVMILLTMFSRLYVGVHTPQDVLVGALTGVAAALLVARIADYIDAHPEKDWIIPAAATALVTVLLLYIYFKQYPMDYVDGKLLVDPKKMTVDGFKDPGRFYGIVLGWFLERRLVKFDPAGTPQQKLMRCIVGALLYIFCWTAICDPIGKAVGFGPVHFFLQAGCQVIFLTVYPYFAVKAERKYDAR